MTAETNKKPKCELIGTDGNVFALIGVAGKVLRKEGMTHQATEMQQRVFRASSYDEALNIICEYVEAC